MAATLPDETRYQGNVGLAYLLPPQQPEKTAMARFVAFWVGLVVLTAASAAGFAQQAADPAQYPSRMVRIVVPFSAGSNTDLQARIIAEKLTELWRQQVIVENRPGVAGTASVAKSAADGYTLMLTSSGHTVAATIHKNLPFDPVKDFAGVTQVTSVPAALIVPPNLPAKTVAEFIALAKERPGSLNFASAGTASTSYLAGEIFKQTAKINIVHVPHRGAPEAMTSIVRGDSQLYMSSANLALELIRAGTVRILAVTSSKRFVHLPHVPTVAESGLPDLVYDSWFGVMAPAGTPTAILNKANEDIVRVLRMPDVQERMSAQGLSVVTQSAQQFDGMIKSEAERFGKILRAAGIGAD
jgi:tripartite-type tricarboxylate transporter receptor subunit TctC